MVHRDVFAWGQITRSALYPPPNPPPPIPIIPSLLHISFLVGKGRIYSSSHVSQIAFPPTAIGELGVKCHWESASCSAHISASPASSVSNFRGTGPRVMALIGRPPITLHHPEPPHPGTHCLPSILCSYSPKSLSISLALSQTHTMWRHTSLLSADSFIWHGKWM